MLIMTYLMQFLEEQKLSLLAGIIDLFKYLKNHIKEIQLCLDKDMEIKKFHKVNKRKDLNLLAKSNRMFQNKM